ncbi:hypothetical protein [Stenotrophomonas sp.]|uniref:hypothetical protein n=1 Tax=Stenotrophomonas sp. TaxID=69392 RepID=UPI00289DCE4B|nr:hypothetical protein [Stenotrophomonas sp.]
METMSPEESAQVAVMAYASAWMTQAVLEGVISHLPDQDRLFEAIRERIAKARADSALVLLDADVSHLTPEFERSAQRWLKALDGLQEG